MNKQKPTQREVKVILSCLGLKEPFKIWNDKRVNGGRMKLWGFRMALGDMSKMRAMLLMLFPYLEDIEVERWGRSTVIKWKYEKEQPDPEQYLVPGVLCEEYPPEDIMGTMYEELPSQRHDW